MFTCKATRLSPRVRALLEGMLNSGDTARVVVAQGLDEVAANADIEDDPHQAQISFLVVQVAEISEACTALMKDLKRVRCVELKDKALAEAEVTETGVERCDNRFAGCVRAERRGGDVLVLERKTEGEPLPGRRTPDYSLTYIWLTSPEADVRSVAGSEVSYWYEAEVNGEKCLFDQFRLFP